MIEDFISVAPRRWPAKGWKLGTSNSQLCPDRPCVKPESSPGVGDLRIEESLDRELRRYVRTARLFDAESAIYSNKLPKLLDVRITAMRRRRRSSSSFASRGTAL